MPPPPGNNQMKAARRAGWPSCHPPTGPGTVPLLPAYNILLSVSHLQMLAPLFPWLISWPSKPNSDIPEPIADGVLSHSSLVQVYPVSTWYLLTALWTWPWWYREREVQNWSLNRCTLRSWYGECWWLVDCPRLFATCAPASLEEPQVQLSFRESNISLNKIYNF